MIRMVASLIAAALAACIAAAGTIPPSGDDAKYVEYGDQFPFVAKISCVSKATGHTQLASCTLIGPRHCVTAAHVVHGTHSWAVSVNGVSVPLEVVVVHEEFSGDKIGCCDVAVGRSSKDFGLDWYPSLYSETDEPGLVSSQAGYGMTGTFASGATRSDGKRRAGSNVIDKIDNGMLVCSNSGGRVTSLEYLICPGDSGGGLFIGNELAGVHSFIAVEKRSPSGRFGEESYHTRISQHREWILEHAR